MLVQFLCLLFGLIANLMELLLYLILFTAVIIAAHRLIYVYRLWGKGVHWDRNPAGFNKKKVVEARVFYFHAGWSGWEDTNWEDAGLTWGILYLLLMAHLLLPFIQHQYLLNPGQGYGELNDYFVHIFTNRTSLVHLKIFWTGANNNNIINVRDWSNFLQKQAFWLWVGMELENSPMHIYFEERVWCHSIPAQYWICTSSYLHCKVSRFTNLKSLLSYQ